MSAFSLKLIAILTMAIDHIGVVFFPQYIVLRMIGRIAFPIFAFFIAEGAYKTGNIEKYLLRLAGFAIISEIPFDYAFHGSFFYLQSQNVMWTFLIALAGIAVYQKLPKYNQTGYHFMTISLVAMMIAYGMQTDYHAWGVVMVMLFFYFRDRKVIMFTTVLVPLFLMCYIHTYRMGYFFWMQYIQMLAVISLPALAMYNGKRGYNMKYLFYLFYPAHLAIIAIIYRLI